MNKDPFKEYIKESEPAKRDKGYAWHTAIGLQAVDGLKTSEYLVRTAVRNIEGEISFKEADELLQSYYKENPARDASDRTEEADKVSARIAALLSERAFSFTPNEYLFHNRTLNISGALKEAGKPDIKASKPDIETLKADIEKDFQPKTVSHILKLREVFLGQTIFGRSDVMKAINIKSSRASELLRELTEHGIIEPVSGHGKGKYRFRQQTD